MNVERGRGREVCLSKWCWTSQVLEQSKVIEIVTRLSIFFVNKIDLTVHKSMWEVLLSNIWYLVILSMSRWLRCRHVKPDYSENGYIFASVYKTTRLIFWKQVDLFSFDVAARLLAWTAFKQKMSALCHVEEIVMKIPYMRIFCTLVSVSCAVILDEISLRAIIFAQRRGGLTLILTLIIKS